MILILIGLKRYLVKYLCNLIFFIIKSEERRLTRGLRNPGCAVPPVRLAVPNANTDRPLLPCFHEDELRRAAVSVFARLACPRLVIRQSARRGTGALPAPLALGQFSQCRRRELAPGGGRSLPGTGSPAPGPWDTS